MIHNYIKNIAFRKKFILSCMLIGLIPVITLGFFCYNQTKNILNDRERTALTNTLIQESNTLQSQFDQYENTMDYVVWNENIKQALNQSYDTNFNMYITYRDIINPLFTTLKSLNHTIKDITLYTNSSIYPSDTTLRPLTEIENLPWYTLVCNNYNSIWISSMEQKELFFVRRIYGTQTNNTSIVKISLHYDSSFSFLKTIYEDSYGIRLINQDKKPIFEFHTPNVQDDTPYPQQFIEASLNDHKQTEYIIEEISDIFKGWSLQLYRPTDTVFASTHTIVCITLVIVFLCLICIILLTYLLSSTIVRPLEDLAANMKQIEQGIFSVTVTHDSSDEIGILIKSFQKMVLQINELINETLKGKIAQQKYEILILQAQISPHFLYNTLSLINSLAILSGQKEIQQISQYLSTFYRTSLNKGKNFISVQDELKNVCSYINIQLLMHSNSFDVKYHIDDNILSLETLNFILQPLVENAIIHGIDCIKKHERGLLKITGNCSDDQLVFQVSDNGPGIPESTLSNMPNSESYGIKNVNKRIQLSFGDQYGLHYISQPGTGTTAILTLPICHAK